MFWTHPLCLTGPAAWEIVDLGANSGGKAVPIHRAIQVSAPTLYEESRELDEGRLGGKKGVIRD